MEKEDVTHLDLWFIKCFYPPLIVKVMSVWSVILWSHLQETDILCTFFGTN